MRNTFNIGLRTYAKKSFTNAVIISIIAAGFLLLSAANCNMNSVYAQSAAGTKQQTSQPSSQPSSKPQVGQVFTFNDKSLPANAPQFCASLASVVKGKAVPDHNLCDVIVYRQAPAIVRNDGMVMNNYSGFGHYIEMVPAVINT